MNPERKRKGKLKAKRVLDIQRRYGIDIPSKIHCCRLESTRVSCSCDMCGNPRTHHKEITMQEKKENLRFKSEMEERNEAS